MKFGPGYAGEVSYAKQLTVIVAAGFPGGR